MDYFPEDKFILVGDSGEQGQFTAFIFLFGVR
jgi:phosphatidate phosphatase APP1